MARDLVLEILTKAKAEGLREAARDLDHAGESADSLRNKFHSLDGEVTIVPGHVERLGQRFGKLSDESSLLQRALAEAQVELKRLGDEFERTGDVDLLRDVGKVRRFRNQLERLIADITPEVAKVGAASGRVAAQGFFDGFKSVKPLHVLIGLAIPAIAAAWIPVGSMLAALVSGATGGGGIAGGIIAAARDNRVKIAASNFAENFMTEFDRATAHFVEPVIRSLAILDKAIEQSQFAKAWSVLAEQVEHVAIGLAGFIDRFGPGIREAFITAKPVLDEFARDLPELGQKFGDMFAMIGRGKGNVAGMKAFMDLLGGTMVFLGRVLQLTSDGFVRFLGFADIALHIAAKLPVVGAAKFFGDLANEVERLQRAGTEAEAWTAILGFGLDNDRHAAEKATRAIGDLMDKIGELRGAIDNQIGSEIGFERAMDNMVDSFKQNGRTLDITAEKGRANMEALMDAAQEAERKRKAAIALGMDPMIAEKAFRADLEKIRNMAKAWGLPAAAVDRYIHRLLVLQGVLVGVSNLTSWVDRLFDSIPFWGRATGGPVWPGQVYRVNEMHEEYFIPSVPGRIAQRSEAGGAAASGPIRLAITLDGTGLAANLKADVQSQGGVDAYFEGARR
jgi:hypothetical protein